MKQLIIAERYCLIGHIVSMAFGLAGLLLVVPHPEVILNLGEVGQNAIQWSMAGGGVVYMILGAATVAIYGYRHLGLKPLLAFMVPSVCLSLASELLGTSTGFPFGHYSYLSGMGYKIAGLVPFTIPLSWFYLGLVSYLIARAGLKVDQKPSLIRHIGAVALGALLLTCWDFVLDPAMSQTAVPFWYWQQPGAFFGMPYQNFAGWMGTGALFMTVAAVLWKNTPLKLDRSQLSLPLVVYLSNFAFAAIMSCGSGFWIPMFLGLLLGVAPVLALWSMAEPSTSTSSAVEAATEMPVASVEVALK